MRPEDLLDVEVAGEPRLSPDGAQVLYVVTRPNARTDGYASELWVVSATDGSTARPLLTSDTRLRRPRWSPDGHRVAVIGDLGDGPQVHHGRRDLLGGRLAHPHGSRHAAGP